MFHDPRLYNESSRSCNRSASEMSSYSKDIERLRLLCDGDDYTVKIVSCSGATKVVCNHEAKLPFYLVMGNAFALC